MNTRRILLIVSLVILLLGLVAAAYLLLFGKADFFSSATPSQTPQDIKITNISENSFSASWITPDKPTIGFLEYGTSNKYGSTANDDRDTGAQSTRLTHHVTVKNLSPSTLYSFRIGSDGKFFDNNGSAFVITTAASTSSTPPLPDTAFGKITPAGSDILVYINFESASPLSTYTKDDGTWLITLNNARNSSLSDYFIVKPETRVSFTATNGQKTSQGSFTAANKAPVPDISLGQAIALAANNSAIGTSTVTPTPSASTKPAISPIPTPVATLKPSPTPTPVIKIATVSADIPVTGGFENTLMFIGGGLALIVIGIFLAL